MRWLLRDGGDFQTGVRRATGDGAVAIVRRIVSDGSRDVSLVDATSDRCVQIVTNGSRAMLVIWLRDGADGLSAIDPSGGTGEQRGYVLENGQDDTYPDAETVPLDFALNAVRRLVDDRELDPALRWRFW